MQASGAEFEGTRDTQLVDELGKQNPRVTVIGQSGDENAKLRPRVAVLGNSVECCSVDEYGVQSLS